MITMSPSPGEHLPQYRDIRVSAISMLTGEDVTRAWGAAPGAAPGLLPTLWRILTVTSVTREVFFTRMNSRRQWWSRLRVMIVITQDTVIVFVMMRAGVLDSDLLPEVPNPRQSLLLRGGEGASRAQSYIGPCRLCS